MPISLLAERPFADVTFYFSLIFWLGGTHSATLNAVWLAGVVAGMTHSLLMGAFFLLKLISVWDQVFYTLTRERMMSLPGWPCGPSEYSWAQEQWSAILPWAYKTWTPQITSWFSYWWKRLTTVRHKPQWIVAAWLRCLMGGEHELVDWFIIPFSFPTCSPFFLHPDIIRFPASQESLELR